MNSRSPYDVLMMALATVLGVDEDEIGEISPSDDLAEWGIDSLRVMAMLRILAQEGYQLDYTAVVSNLRLENWQDLMTNTGQGKTTPLSRDSVQPLVTDTQWNDQRSRRTWGPLVNHRPGFVPMPVERAARYREAGLWQGRTFDDLLAQAVAYQPGKIALTDGNTSLSYQELWEQIESVAVNIAQSGVNAGDHVILYLPNIIEFYPIYLGLVRLGAIPLLALPGHREAELSAFARQVGAVGIITLSSWLGTRHGAIAQQVIAALAGEGLQLRLWADPAALVARPVNQADQSTWGVHPEDAAFLLVSGGSTGIPKLIARAMDPYILTLERSNTRCAVTRDEVYLAALPVAHNFANSSPGVLGVLTAGGTAVLASAPSPDVCFPLIDRYGVTMTALVPPLAMIWVDALGDAPAPASLRTILLGGAKLTPSAAERVERAFPGRLQQVFGMAEGLVCYTDKKADQEVRLTTQGYPLCDQDELEVRDPDGNTVEAGSLGELWTRGPYTISGYYLNPEANARSFDRRGFYRTGDLVRIRADGNLVVEGRAVQTINRAGEKIIGEEVEDALLRMPQIIDAAVVGQADDLLGERIVAVITCHPGQQVDANEIRTHLRAIGLASYKHPDSYRFVEQLPATAVGKTDRQILSLEEKQ